MTRALPLAVFLLLSCVALLAVGAGAASAATPSPTPSPNVAQIGFADYTGTQRVVSTHSDGSIGRDLSQPATYQVRCTAPGRCTVNVPGQTVAITNGIGRTTVATHGDPCSIQTWHGKIAISLTATSSRLVMDYLETGLPDVICDGGHESIDSQQVTFQGELSGGDPCVILASCPSPSPAAAGRPTGTTAPRVATAPSVLSALPVAATALTPRNALWAAAAAVILVLLIALPTQLFNSASETASERIGTWWARIRPTRAAGASPPSSAGRPRVAWSGWPFAALGVLAASVISALVDPQLGFDEASLRTVLSILVSFILDVVLGWFVLLLIVRRTHPESVATFEFKPLTLIVVAVAVLLTRITGFQPGIVFGLVAGVAFGGVLGTAKARVALTGLGYSFVIGVLAWIGYSALSGVAGPHPGAVLVFVQESLSSAAIAGIAALPIALLPIGALVGREVWKWNRIAWAAGYTIGLVGFFLVLMPMPFAWADVPLSLWTWIGLYLAYAVVAVVVWLVVTRPWKKVAAPA
jgi:hypothetical protein